MTAPHHPRASLLPFAVALVAIGLFAAMDAVMKKVSIQIGAYNAVFWRMLVGIGITGIVYLGARAPRPTATALRFHIIRGGVASVMAVAFFWGLVRMPLAEAIALTFIAPIIALFLAGVIIGEKIGSAAIGASLLGLMGVAVILWGQESSGDQRRTLEGAAAVLGSAVLYAYNIVLMRQQAQVAGPAEISFYQHLIVALFLALVAPFYAVLPEPGQFPAIAACAVLGTCSLFLLAWAYRRAQAQHLAPVEYSALVWAALLGYLFFDDAVRISTLVGAAMIVAGCLIGARSAQRSAHQTEAAL